jgi:hypothetical protein
MARIVDAKGWPIAPGAWIRHLKRKGEVLSIEVTEQHPEGVVEYRDAKTMGTRLASAPTVTVMPAGSKSQDRYERELAIPLSQRTITRVQKRKEMRGRKKIQVRSPSSR